MSASLATSAGRARTPEHGALGGPFISVSPPSLSGHPLLSVGQPTTHRQRSSCGHGCESKRGKVSGREAVMRSAAARHIAAARRAPSVAVPCRGAVAAGGGRRCRGSGSCGHWTAVLSPAAGPSTEERRVAHQNSGGDGRLGFRSCRRGFGRREDIVRCCCCGGEGAAERTRDTRTIGGGRWWHRRAAAVAFAPAAGRKSDGCLGPKPRRKADFPRGAQAHGDDRASLV